MTEANLRLLRTTEACERGAIGKTKLEELISSGLIEVVWIGGARRVLAASLDAYIENLRDQPSPGKGA